MKLFSSQTLIIENLKRFAFLLIIPLGLSGCMIENKNENSAVLSSDTGDISLFAATDGINGAELWSSDGTESGTVLVKDINTTASTGSSPSVIDNLGPIRSVVLNGFVYFSATDATHGTELWKSDGTEAGTVLIKDINTTASSNPNQFTLFNNAIYFSADDGINGNELWKTDGTESGTVLVPGIDLAMTSSATPLAASSNVLFFNVSNSYTVKAELWTTDGTTTGLVKEIGGNINWPVVLNNTLYFQGTDTTSGIELWLSNGTPSGTTIIKDINPGTNDSTPIHLVAFNNKIYFQANDGTNGYELWVSDGTSVGTTMVENLAAGSASSDPKDMIVFGSKLYFSANNLTNGKELFVLNETGTTIELVKDINTTPNISEWSQPDNFIEFNNNLYFRANDGVNGYELWKTNGTESGTLLVKDINIGSTPSNATPKVIANNKLFIIANDGTNGSELWTSDGTAIGTTLVKDINPAGSAF